jgi:hypothetical protein
MSQAAGDHLHCRGAPSSDRGSDDAVYSFAGPVPDTESSSGHAPGSRSSFCANDSDAIAVDTCCAVDAVNSWDRGDPEYATEAE